MRMQRLGILGVAAALALAWAAPVHAQAWKRCLTCHNFTDRAKVGPGLGKGPKAPGVFGRKAGTFPGFRYLFTKYIQGEPWVWDEAHLRKWMCNSKKAIKEFTGNPDAKTKMPPQKVCDPKAQDEVIAKLKEISR